MAQGQRPVHEIRFGYVKCAIWKNATEKGSWYNVTISRSYKQGESWHESTHFSRDDLLLVAKIADQAHSWIHQQQRAPAAESRESTP